MKVSNSLKNLPGSEVLTIIDSTKIKCFKDCPRKFFYNFVLHWRKDEPNIHLEFGTAWHLAKEHILNHGYDEATINDAFAIFISHYRKFYAPSDDLNNAPKDPGNARKALTEYCNQFGFINKRMEILATEIAGRVILVDNFEISFKLDVVLRDSVGVWAMDHKTSGRDSQIYDDAWLLSTQMNTYTHALHCMYPPTEVKGAYVDLSVLRKMGNLHKRIPVKKTFAHLEEWHWNTVQWFEFLQHQYELLNKNDNPDILFAFPKNTESCTKYGKCPYMDLCMSPQNPMTRGIEPPMGYRREVWNPHSGDAGWKPKHIMDPTGKLRKPTLEEERAYEEARKHLDETARRREGDDFEFKGFI